MQTYSHFLITAAAGAGLKKREIPVRAKAFLWGSVLPDIPLGVLSLVYLAYYRWFASLPAGVTMVEQYDVLYFTHPLWQAGHNFFHAPLIVLTMLAVGISAGRRGRGWGWSLAWFALGCGLHSFIDVFTHHDDGPLLLFPLNWSWRFMSPISYWDVDYYAGIVSPLEHLLDLGILIFLGREWFRKRKTNRAAAPSI